MIALPEDSPIFWLPKTCELQPDMQVQFMSYRVAEAGSQWGSPRSTHRIDVSNISKFLESTLDPGWELALTSAVYRHSYSHTVDRHFMMADLSPGETSMTWASPFGAEHTSGIEYDSDDEEIPAPSPVYYRSGGSFHLYWQRTVVAERWPEFVGELLTAKGKNGEPVVDVRAAGYALRRGFTALRLTKNTDRYLQVPTRV